MSPPVKRPPSDPPWRDGRDLKAVSKKPVEHVKDDTLILADQSEKAISQVRENVRELLAAKFPAEKAGELAKLLSEGTWTHEHPIAYDTAKSSEFLDLMALYPNPSATSRRSSTYWNAGATRAFTIGIPNIPAARQAVAWRVVRINSLTLISSWSGSKGF